MKNTNVNSNPDQSVPSTPDKSSILPAETNELTYKGTPLSESTESGDSVPDPSGVRRSDPTTLYQATIDLANKLAASHGPVVLDNEQDDEAEEPEDWYLLHMACPHCLAHDGPSELNLLHLEVHATRYFVDGMDMAAFCQRTGAFYRISDLVEFMPLAARGFTGKLTEPKVFDTSKPYPPNLGLSEYGHWKVTGEAVAVD